jgi:hypothetical protein
MIVLPIHISHPNQPTPHLLPGSVHQQSGLPKITMDDPQTPAGDHFLNRPPSLGGTITRIGALKFIVGNYGVRL